MTIIKMYRKKPVMVTALQWTGDNEEELGLFTNNQFVVVTGQASVYDYLHDTWVTVNLGDYIIRGVQGEFYPCREDVFNETYEEM